MMASGARRAGMNQIVKSRLLIVANT